MLDPPPISKHTLVAALRTNWSVHAAALTFLPLGHDADTSVCHVATSAGRDLFLKLRTRARFSAPSLLVPHHLQQQGLAHVLAPLPTGDGRLWADVDGFTLALYPFVAGQNGAAAGLTAAQWRGFGALARQVHDSHLPRALREQLPRETYTPSRYDLLPRLQAAVDGSAFANAAQREFAAVWRSHQATVDALVERADTLRGRLRQAPAPPVLCHADLHPWNLLVADHDQWWLIDWDEIILAPRERDLMFAIGGIGGDGVRPDTTAAFRQGYGDAAIDDVALAYYRAAWALQDIAAYGEQVFYALQLSEDSRAEAVAGLTSVFAAGSIAALALSSA